MNKKMNSILIEHVQKQHLVLVQEWGAARPSEVFLKIYSYKL